MKHSYVISYVYPGIVNGRDVGRVFAKRVPWVAPRAWSYTQDAMDATHFESRDAAEAELAKKRNWPEAAVLPLVREP